MPWISFCFAKIPCWKHKLLCQVSDHNSNSFRQIRQFKATLSKIIPLTLTPKTKDEKASWNKRNTYVKCVSCHDQEQFTFERNMTISRFSWDVCWVSFAVNHIHHYGGRTLQSKWLVPSVQHFTKTSVENACRLSCKVLWLLTCYLWTIIVQICHTFIPTNREGTEKYK